MVPGMDRRLHAHWAHLPAMHQQATHTPGRVRCGQPSHLNTRFGSIFAALQMRRSREQGSLSKMLECTRVTEVGSNSAQLLPKCKGRVSEKGKLIVMYWTEMGHCLDDEAVESISNTLLLRPKTKSEGKQIIGVINYSDTAFQYSPTELSIHAQHMATLNAAISGEKLQWTTE